MIHTKVSSDELDKAPLARASLRRFLIRSRDPAVAPRLAPAINIMIEYLEQYGEIPWNEAVAAGLRAGTTTAGTLHTRLHEAVKVGFVAKQGTFDKLTQKDTRTVRLIDWPTGKETQVIREVSMQYDASLLGKFDRLTVELAPEGELCRSAEHTVYAKIPVAPYKVTLRKLHTFYCQEHTAHIVAMQQRGVIE